MLHQLKTAGVIYQGVACNTCCLVIWLRESAINNHQASTSFNRIFSLCRMYRNVSVDYMAILSFDLKSIEYAIDNVFIVAELEIRSF